MAPPTLLPPPSPSNSTVHRVEMTMDRSNPVHSSRKQEQSASAAAAEEECYGRDTMLPVNCVYHVKFGRCKLGMNCKFNHPPKQPAGLSISAMASEKHEPPPAREEHPPPQQQCNRTLDCFYHVKMGNCRFGNNCKFNHPPPRMPMMDYTLLKDVTQESHHWRIRVRVTRFSEFRMSNEPDKILGIDLVLLDEKGDMMDAKIPADHVAKFKPLLKEDNVYYIKYFEVIRARTQYKPVDRMVMARFTAHTSVSQDRQPPSTFPTHACKILSFDELRNRAYKKDVLSDTIGVLTAVGSAQTVCCSGIIKALLNVHITDGRETAVVSLWGPHAGQFQAEGLHQQAKHGPVVILLVGFTVKLRDNHQLSLQGSAMCRWYTNAPLQETITLINSLQGGQHEVRVIELHTAQREPVHAKVSDISQLNPHEAVGNSYIVKIAIKGLVPAEAWWYMACSTCKRSAVSEGNEYKCSRCSTNATETRYKLAIVVVDPSDIANDKAKTAEFIFFGQNADQLIGVPVLNLVAAARGARDIVPPEIEAIYGRQYIIRASVSRRSLQRIRISYQVEYLTPILPEPDAMHAGAAPVSNHPTITASGRNCSDMASGSGLTIADKVSASSLHMLIQEAHATTSEPEGPAALLTDAKRIYASHGAQFEPTPPTPQVIAAPKPGQKHKSPVSDEDDDHRTKTWKSSCPAGGHHRKASVVRKLFQETPTTQSPNSNLW